MKNQAQWVLLTGASSGIGLEMARQFAARGYQLILVARSTDKLLRLAAELHDTHGNETMVITKDLSDVQHAKSLYEELKAAGVRVDILVNNAGVGLYGEHTETSMEEELAMINLNISSLMVLSKLFLRDMRERDRGKILNIGSLLSFFPFPYYSVYAATKAFVLSYSEALHTELRGSNVQVSTACPGPVDSNFTTAGMAASNAYQFLPLDAPEAVAKTIVQQFLKGKRTIKVGLPVKLITFTTKHSPQSINLAVNQLLARPAKKKKEQAVITG